MTAEIGIPSSPKKMRVDVTSDVICPFCLIGIKQLLSAADQYKSAHPENPLDLDIRFLPYQLNPTLSEEPQPRSVYGIQKFGAERWKMISEQMIEKFKAVGVDADLNGQTSSSHLAHRLQTYTLLNKPNLQLPLVMDIFQGFHAQGHHPSDKTWLSKLAVDHGIFKEEKEAEEFLNGDECDAEVRRGYTTAHRLGVTGVPFFVFQDKYAASGAMGVEEFVNIFEEISRRESKETSSPTLTSRKSESASP